MKAGGMEADHHDAISGLKVLIKAESAGGFTRIELLVILACLGLLALTQLPSLGKSREGGHQAVCMNNLHQLGLALMMYSEENRDFVPEEGNTANAISDPGSATTSDNLHTAWYNLAVQPYYPRLVDLYVSNAVPLPWSNNIFSCPSTPAPDATYNKPPTVAQAFFMYGMNGRICVNFGTRATGGAAQTKFSTIPKPSITIFMGEVDPNSATDGSGFSPSISQSVIVGDHSAGSARHQGLAFFVMADGHFRAARTNEFVRTASEASSAPIEWAQPRTMYWFPTPTTPD